MRRKRIQLMTGVLQYCLVYKGPIIVGQGYIINWQGTISWPQITNLTGDELPEDTYMLMPDETKPKDQIVVVNWSVQ